MRLISRVCSPRGARVAEMRRRALALSALLASSLAHAEPPDVARNLAPDFARDIAPMIERCCLACHERGRAGAVALTTSTEVKRVAHSVLQVLQSGVMPPFAPSEGVMRVPSKPTASERAAFAAWVEAGATIPAHELTLKSVSVRAELPAVREWRVADGWTIAATERRVMRSFQQLVGGGAELLIGGWRVRCESPGLITTMLVTAGDAQLAKSLDERDASQGFKFTADLATTPSSALGGVGSEGFMLLPAGFAMRLRPTDALVVESHADGRGKQESGACVIEALRPLVTECAALRVVHPLVVSAQSAARTHSEGAHIEYELPPLDHAVDLACITLRPGPDAVRVELQALRAGNDAPLTLIRVERYDIHIDRPYVVDPVVTLEVGTRLVLTVQALNAELAARATPQAVLLVADALTEKPAGEATVAATPLVCRPITRAAEFRAVMGYDAEPRTGDSDCAGFSWFEAIALANALSTRDGLTAVYAIDFPQHDDRRLVGAVVTIGAGNGWRLPTSAEWERSFAADTAGSGDLWNWTFDSEGSARVVRGGCWADTVKSRGSAARSSVEPTTRNELFGACFVRNDAASK